MPDEQGNKTADEETLPETSLHAYKDGREEDVEGPLDEQGQLDEEDAEGLKDKH
jgi:hypothetical protein